MDILGDIHLGTVDEEVNVHEVVRAPLAEAEEVIEVSQTLRTSAIGHCRSAELDGAVVRLQIGLIYRDTLGGGQIRLRWVVRFVGAV